MKPAFPALCVIGALAASPALSQTPDQAAQLRQAFDTCVWSASKDSPLFAKERRMAVETAFMACKTEEDAIITIMRLRNMTPANIAAVMTTIRTQVKQAVVAAPSR